MKCVEITPRRLAGSVTVPPSKSVAHRAIICGSLARGQSMVSPVELSDDIKATMGAAQSLGARMELKAGALHIKGGLAGGDAYIDAGESGSTLRFFIPIALAGGRRAVFSGRGKLPSRPLGPYYDIFDQFGISYKNANGCLPLEVDGKLKAGVYKLPGNVSSQFITGLLFALPLLDGDSVIELTTPLESSGYIDLTLDAVKAFGVEIEKNSANSFKIKGNQSYKPCNYRVEGDFSQAAFWLVAGAIGGHIRCLGLNTSSRQGDAEIVNILRRFGAVIDVKDGIYASPAPLKAVNIDAGQIPDIVPVLAVAAAFADGETKISNAGRLRIKECDRLAAVCTELKRLGADIEQQGDGMIIRGRDYLEGGVCDGWNDHRIVMALSIAACRCKNSVVINGSGAVSKSYPGFFEHYKALGGIVREFSMGE